MIARFSALALLALVRQQGPLEGHPPPQQQPPHAQQQQPYAQKPVPLTPPPTWITQRDYPNAARGTGAKGRTAFRLTVDAGGRIASCAITASSGWKVLDDRACELLRQRARFRPARDAANNPIPFTWSSWFVWKRP